MTYDQVEADFVQCIDKDVVRITYNTSNNTYSYDCNYSCVYFNNNPKCSFGSSTARWCRNDGKHRKRLLSKAHQLHPELFI